MSAFKPYPEVSLLISEDSSAMQVVDSRGEVLVTDMTCDTAVLERMVACWNACRKLYAPANHIEAADEYAARLERLRKDAWARVQQLEAELAAIATPAQEAAE